MRAAFLFLAGLFFSFSFSYAGDFKIVINKIITASVDLNDAGELVAEKGHELEVVEMEKEKSGTGKEKIVWLIVATKGKKYYLSYSNAEREAPKLLLTEKPDDNSRWIKQESIPYGQLRRDSPAWGSTRFLPANGAYTNRILAAGNDKKLVLLSPEKLTGEFAPVGRAIHYDNLNDGK